MRLALTRLAEHGSRICTLMLCLGLLLGPVSAWAATSGPQPGTAAQVAALVKASTSITSLTSTTAAELSKDSPVRAVNTTCPTPGSCGCFTATQCVYGDLTSKKTVVLFGDSHALMWLPAVTWAASAARFKLILIFAISSPIASLPDAKYKGVLPNPNCNQWRHQSISLIKSISPKVIILGERTARVVSSLTGRRYSAQQWQRALEATMASLSSPRRRIALLEDIPYASNFSPAACLAANPSNVQACSIPFPNPKAPGQQVAEASRSEGRAGPLHPHSAVALYQSVLDGSLETTLPTLTVVTCR